MEELNWKYWYTDVDKDQNQYTYEECNRIGPVDAKYVKSSNKDFNGNPFIEALPRPRDGKELINAYTCPIPAVDMGELDDMTINKEVLSFIMKKQDIFVKEVVSFLKKFLVSRKQKKKFKIRDIFCTNFA